MKFIFKILQFSLKQFIFYIYIFQQYFFTCLLIMTMFYFRSLNIFLILVKSHLLILVFVYIFVICFDLFCSYLLVYIFLFLHISSVFYHFNYLFYVCIFDCAGSSSLCGLFSSCREQGPLQLWSLGFSLLWLLCCGARALGCLGFSTYGTRSQRLWFLSSQHRLNSCGAWAQLLCHMQDLSGQEIEPMSPALAGRFFTTEPPRKRIQCF